MRSGVEIGYLGVGSSSSYLTFTLQEEGSEAWSSSLMKRLCTQSESQISLKGANTGNLLWEYMIKRVCTSHIRGVSPTEAWMTEKRKHYCLLWARPTCPSLTPDTQKPGTPWSTEDGYVGSLCQPASIEGWRRLQAGTLKRHWQKECTDKRSWQTRHVLPCNQLYHSWINSPLMWSLLDP